MIASTFLTVVFLSAMLVNYSTNKEDYIFFFTFINISYLSMIHILTATDKIFTTILKIAFSY